MDEEFVTIGITCFNAEKTIQRAIECALKQTWKNKEILIVDDKSSDNSLNLIENIICSNESISLIKNDKNLGPAGSRNILIKNAKGNYIVFFDDDDESLENRINEQYNTLKKYQKQLQSDKIFCYASGIRVYPNNYKIILDSIKSSIGKMITFENYADYIFLYENKKNNFFGNGTPSCSLMAKTNTLKFVKGFDENLRRVEDVDLALKLCLKKGFIVGTKEKLFIQYSTEAEDKSADKNLESELKLVNKYKYYLDKINMYNYAYNWPKLRYYYFKNKYINLSITLLSLILQNPVKTFTHFFKTAPKRLLHDYKITSRSYKK